MSLREKSRKFLEKSLKDEPSPQSETHLGLRKKAELLLNKLFGKKSLRQRAQELLTAKEKGLVKVSEERPHKGLLERSRELLQKLLAKSEEKKNSETPEGSMPEPTPLELTPPPQPSEKILENVVQDEEENQDKDLPSSVKETIKDFFEKLANALQGVEIFVSKEKKEQLEGEEKSSPFFDDESLARRPKKSWFYLQEEYPIRLGSPFAEKDFLKEPFWIYPQKGALEIKDPYAPLPLLLSYRAEEIATGEDRKHLRELKNAEELLKAGEFNQGLALLYRTLGNVENQDNKRKIKQNIQDVENYLKEEKNRLSLAWALGQKSFTTEAQEPKIEQKIENAQFQISSAQMQAANLQIVSAQPTSTTTQPSLSETQVNLKEVSSLPTLEKIEAKEEILKTAEVPIPELPQKEPILTDLSHPQTLAQPVVEPAESLITTETKEPHLKGSKTESQSQADSPSNTLLAPPTEQTLGETTSLSSSAPEKESEGVISPPVVPPLSSGGQVFSEDDMGEKEEQPKKEEKQVQEIRGVLELKAPEEEDTPFLTLTYDFQKIPHEFILSRDHQIFEYAYYKYKPMLLKAQKYIKRKQITKALNYYRVIREQQIPPEFRRMIDQNIKDITEYLQKYLMARQ